MNTKCKPSLHPLKKVPWKIFSSWQIFWLFSSSHNFDYFAFFFFFLTELVVLLNSSQTVLFITVVETKSLSKAALKLLREVTVATGAVNLRFPADANLSFPLQEKEDHFESVQLKSSRSQNIWRINAAFKERNLISIFTGPYFKHILAHIAVVISVRNAQPFRKKEDRKQTIKLDCLTTWLSTLPKKPKQMLGFHTGNEI